MTFKNTIPSSTRRRSEHPHIGLIAIAIAIASNERHTTSGKSIQVAVSKSLTSIAASPKSLALAHLFDLARSLSRYLPHYLSLFTGGEQIFTARAMSSPFDGGGGRRVGRIVGIDAWEGAEDWEKNFTKVSEADATKGDSDEIRIAMASSSTSSKDRPSPFVRYGPGASIIPRRRPPAVRRIRPQQSIAMTKERNSIQALLIDRGWQRQDKVSWARAPLPPISSSAASTNVTQPQRSEKLEQKVLCSRLEKGVSSSRRSSSQLLAQVVKMCWRKNSYPTCVVFITLLPLFCPKAIITESHAPFRACQLSGGQIQSVLIADREASVLVTAGAAHRAHTEDTHAIYS